MAIQLTDLKLYKSATVNDTSSNGGRISANEVASGSVANLFDPVSESERTAGSTKWRKAFPKVHSDGADIGYNPRLFFADYTPGDDVFSFIAATQTNTQADITGSEQRYGAGQLNANVSAGATSLAVLVETGNTGIFADTMTARVSDGTNTEFRTISGAPGVVGNVVTITLSAALDNAYLAASTIVSSVYEPADIQASISDFVVTTAGDGDYDSNEITLNNRGAIEQTWTLTWTSATNFGIVGDTVGSVGTGTVGGGAAPNNPDFTEAYFTLAAAGFSGTWASGDTIVFKTHPAAAPIFIKRVVPASASVAGSNTTELKLRVEGA